MKTSLARALLGLSLFSRVQSEICPLCETPADLPKRWNFRLQDGRTCRDVYLALGSLDANDSVCQTDKQVAQELCCSVEEPEPFSVPPTLAPVYNGPFGNEPDCPICGTGEYPGIPTAFIVARYVGEYTCAQLYHRGLNGMTPNFMCGPLQDFAEPVCGCGGYNPKCRADPTQCWGNNPSPQAAPASMPAPAPVVYVEPTIFNRKTPPETGKYNQKLSGGRGGAGGSKIRGTRRVMENGAPVQENHFPEIDDPKMDSPLLEADESQ
jgi:hypothetical protein